MKEGFWEKEEFEDLVARGLIAMCETKIKKYKDVVKHARFTEEMFLRIKKLGCYYACDDRILLVDENENGISKAVQQLDVINEGRPDLAAMTYQLKNCYEMNDENSMRHNCYVEHCNRL
jgi:hypothetical protein